MPRLVASFTPGVPLRNDFTGYVGMQFAPTTNLTFNKIGLWCSSGNAGAFSVAVTAGNPSTPMASASIDLTGKAAGAFYYTDIPQITLASGTTYFLCAFETAGNGQLWANDGGYTSLNSCSFVQSSYANPGDTYPTGHSYDTCYVGVDLDYVAGSANTSMVAAKGAIGLNGLSTNLRASRTFPAAAGSVSVNGVAAGFKAGHSFAAAKGTIALAGQQAAFHAGTSVALASGQIALGGNAAALRALQHRTLACGSGHIALGGTWANLMPFQQPMDVQFGAKVWLKRW